MTGLEIILGICTAVFFILSITFITLYVKYKNDNKDVIEGGNQLKDCLSNKNAFVTKKADDWKQTYCIKNESADNIKEFVDNSSSYKYIKKCLSDSGKAYVIKDKGKPWNNTNCLKGKDTIEWDEWLDDGYKLRSLKKCMIDNKNNVNLTPPKSEEQWLNIKCSPVKPANTK
jgi:hypothetical protein